jgi:hypothetical protein
MRYVGPLLRRFRSGLLTGAALGLVVAVFPAPSFAGPRDIASTQAYLRASYEYGLALQADMPQVKSAVAGFATQVKAECGGALQNVEARLGRGETRNLRAFGEKALHTEQLELLGQELDAAGQATMLSPEQPAFLKLQNLVAPLTWEDVALGAALVEDLAEIHTRLFSSVPAVCLDIRSWITSGFRLLSSGTKAFLTAREAQQRQESDPRIYINKALQRFETSEGRALAAKLSRLSSRHQAELVTAYEGIESVRPAVGLRREYGPKLREESHKVNETTQVSSGTTEAGGHYMVSVVRGSGSCAFEIQVQDSGSPSTNAPMCAAPTHTTVQRVRCEEGERIVEAMMPATVRKVLLHLSGGRVVTSSTIALPAKLGGPVAFYYQAVPRGSKVPVSMAELDGHGDVLATVTVNPADKCVRYRLHSVSGGPHILAHGVIPGGPRFTIAGNSFAYNGPSQLSLSVGVEDLGGGGSNLTGVHPNILVLTTFDGCYPVDYHIVYGILKATRDAVRAHAGGRIIELQRVKLPASLRTHGMLVYGAFTGPVESVVVSTRTRRVTDGESLEQWTKGQGEYCEGFIEPGRAPQDEGRLF